MSAPVTSTQPVLTKLQQTFAFLRHTLRALYSPSDFLKAARPPWFEPGRQQDCSEFLRYLLDTLQEQEKSVRSGVITNFREHKVIGNFIHFNPYFSFEINFWPSKRGPKNKISS